MSIEKEPESDSAEQHSTGSTIGHGGDDDVTMPPRPREFAATATPPGDEATLAPEIFAGQANVGDRIRYFGDYELVEEIARGGMGVVFRARQVNLNRVVALKMILAGQFAGQQDVQRFYTEAEAAAKLDHPGIVPIFEIGEHQGQHYFSMGFIEGQSLADKVKDGPLPPREAAELVKSICEAMAYAHERGVIHRDLKPANILIDTNGRPKVTDFGLAKKTEADSQLTGTGQILGTPAYMPPEQASGRTDEVGVPADVYALGAILYCLLTGRPPFQAANPMDTLLQVLEKEPVAPRTLNSLIDRDLETICLKCLEKHAARRYLSAAELGDELNRYLQHEPIRARPVGSVERTWRWCKRNPGIAALSAVLVLLVTGATVGSILVAYREARLAESEFEARSFAEDARREAEKQERAAVQSRDEANQLLVRQYISNGLRLQDDDDGAAALLWFIEALKLDQQNPARSRIHRLRLAKAFEKLPDITRANYLHERIFKTEVSQDRSVATTVEYGDGELINRVWDLQEYRVLNLTAPISSRNEFASMNWDGSLLAVCAENGIELYDRDALRTGQPLQTFPQLVSTACALSPDGKFLATAGAPSVSDTLLAAAGGKLARPGIVLWELDSGKRMHELQTAIVVTALTFSPDGRFLAAGSEVREDVVQVWNTESGQQVRTPLLPKSKAWGLKFSPDASQLLAVSDEAIRVWSLAAETPARELKSYRGMIDAAWDSEGQRVITGCSDRTARIWDARTGKQLVGPLQHASEIVSVAFSPTSEYVATGSTDRTARVWDAKSGVPITPPLRHSNFIRSVFFGADDNHLITVANEHDQGSTLRRFDLTRGQAIGEPLVREADTDVASISDLTFGKRGKILTGLSRGKVSIWWIGDKLAAPRQLKIDGTQITSVAIHPDEQTIATGDDRGWVTLWHAEDGRPLQEFRTANGGNSGGLLGSLLGRQEQLDPSVSAIGFSPDGKWLAVAHGKELEIWDLATGEKTTETPISHPEVIECLRFSPGSKLLLTGCQDGAGRLFHSDSGELARTVKHDSWVLHVDFDADASHFLTASADFTVRIWDTQQEAKPVVVRMAGGVQQAVFSLDGKSVATACWDGRAAIASAQNGQPIVPPLQHGEHVRYVQFTPDGSMLLTRSDDGAARLWDVETGQRIAQWQPRGGSVRSAALHPSGESLAISGDLGEVSILRLEPDDRSIEQLTTAAEILANQNIDPRGGLGRLSDTQWIQRYLSRSSQ